MIATMMGAKFSYQTRSWLFVAILKYLMKKELS
jgi:hypothetical protein